MGDHHRASQATDQQRQKPHNDSGQHVKAHKAQTVLQAADHLKRLSERLTDAQLGDEDAIHKHRGHQRHCKARKVRLAGEPLLAVAIDQIRQLALPQAINQLQRLNQLLSVWPARGDCTKLLI